MNFINMSITLTRHFSTIQQLSLGTTILDKHLFSILYDMNTICWSLLDSIFFLGFLTCDTLLCKLISMFIVRSTGE